MNQFNYIISGAGAAGLSLLMRMIRHPFFFDKKILVVDRQPKVHNDRTWCFWEQGSGLFEPLVHHRWQKMHFYSPRFSELLDLYPYEYKMIRGADFYSYVIEQAQLRPNITIQYGNVEALGNTGSGGFVLLDGEMITADYVFNSIMFGKPEVPLGKYFLLQHFKGWIIQANEGGFDPNTAILMDFRVDQRYGTTFVYVLPLSNSSALIEYTLFSAQTLPTEQYDDGLKAYIAQYLQLGDYSIVEEEFGTIPMTNIKFVKEVGRIINIGTAGGQTKASSGYTFSFIQKQSDALVVSLVKNGYPHVQQPFFEKRFHLYDSTLLNVLHNHTMGGADIFADLFSKNDPARVLRFLDNESDLQDEINIMSSVPSKIFLKAALKEMFK